MGLIGFVRFRVQGAKPRSGSRKSPNLVQRRTA